MSTRPAPHRQLFAIIENKLFFTPDLQALCVYKRLMEEAQLDRRYLTNETYRLEVSEPQLIPRRFEASGEHGKVIVDRM